jgi:glycerol-3-phosphate dehydrogenase (NAD(P)+)
MNKDSGSTVAILGAGSWGTALAMLLARNGVSVRLWDRDVDHIAHMQRDRVNDRYLPGIELPDGIEPFNELETAVAQADFILIAVPSAGFRSVLQRVASRVGSSFNLIWASKGLEPGSGKFLHQVVDEELPEHRETAVISGPSFAKEVARGLPTAVTVASRNSAYATTVAKLFHCTQFRTYTCDDVVGGQCPCRPHYTWPGGSHAARSQTGRPPGDLHGAGGRRRPGADLYR